MIANPTNGDRKLRFGILIVLVYIAAILTLAFLAELLHSGGAF